MWRQRRDEDFVVVLWVKHLPAVVLSPEAVANRVLLPSKMKILMKPIKPK
jgi:hypothetical protein